MTVTMSAVVSLVWLSAVTGGAASSVASQDTSFTYSTEQRGFFLQEDPGINANPPSFVSRH